MTTTYKTVSRHPKKDAAVSNPTKVELSSPGVVVIDGVKYDYEHAADNGQDLFAPIDHLVVLRDGTNWTVLYQPEVAHGTDLPAATSTDYADADLPAYPVWPDGETQAEQTVSSTHSTSPSAVSDLQKKKNAANMLNGALDAWFDGVISEGKGHPAPHEATGRNFLVGAWRALYLVFNLDDTTYSASNKISWAQKMAQGAADCTNAFEFYQKIGGLTEAQIPDGTKPLTWVGLDDLTADNLADVVANSAAEFTDTVSRWTSVTLDVSDQKIRDGSWIDDLT